MFVYLSPTGLAQTARRFVYGIIPAGIQGFREQPKIHPIVDFCLVFIRLQGQSHSHVVESGGAQRLPTKLGSLHRFLVGATGE